MRSQDKPTGALGRKVVLLSRRALVQAASAVAWGWGWPRRNPPPRPHLGRLLPELSVRMTRHNPGPECTILTKATLLPINRAPR